MSPSESDAVKSTEIGFSTFLSSAGGLKGLYILFDVVMVVLITYATWSHAKETRSRDTATDIMTPEICDQYRESEET